jgi:ubiquinone/menaquinone biosynthesis C-methylase UbiE
MNIKELQRNWNTFGKQDPLWAIITRADKKGKKWDLDEFFKTGDRKIHQLFDMLREQKIKVNKGSALDFGCGVGRLTLALASHFQQVNGVDIAESMIELANRYNKYPERCKYFVNTKDDLSLFSERSFDFIYTVIVLQHMRQEYAKSYIAEFVRLLKPSGVAVFQMPAKYIGPPQQATKQSLFQRVTVKLKQMLKPLIKLILPERAHMEMYGIEHDEMVSYLKQLGVVVADVRKDDSPGPLWESYQYTIIKTA